MHFDASPLTTRLRPAAFYRKPGLAGFGHIFTTPHPIPFGLLCLHRYQVTHAQNGRLFQRQGDCSVSGPKGTALAHVEHGLSFSVAHSRRAGHCPRTPNPNRKNSRTQCGACQRPLPHTRSRFFRLMTRPLSIRIRCRIREAYIVTDVCVCMHVLASACKWSEPPFLLVVKCNR